MSELPLPPPADPSPITRTFPAIRIRQPIGDIFVCVMSYDILQKITFFDVRRVLRDSRDIEMYLGIQRPLNERRVEEIKKYVTFRDATFPTSIILAVDDEYTGYDEQAREIALSNVKRGEATPSVAFSNLCRVIDGQHRIAGLEGFNGESFEVPVSLFVGSDISDQAYIFATVNLQQTKVNSSLAYDLFALAKSRSPDKTCHNIAVALDSTEGSPFFHRIKRLGVATAGRDGTEETITQATFVRALLPYISDDSKVDRDLLLRGKTPSMPSSADARRLCLRALFIKENDIEIGKIIEQYFLAVSRRWPIAWKSGGRGLILNRTNGYRALMRVFGQAYNYFAKPGEHVAAEEYLKLFSKVDVTDDYFNIDRFKPGTSGEASLRHFLEQEMGLSDI